MENQASEKSLIARSQSCTLDARSEALVAKLARFYSVVGSRPDEPGALALMAEILTESASDDQIDRALTLCARECRYPIRLPDILQRIDGQEVPQLEAEARKAWEIVIAFVAKWVQSTVEGNYVIDRGVRSSEPPKLSPRVLDTIRRTGGWRTYKCMHNEDYPFVQKRFFEEFEAWKAVEQVPTSRLLAEMPRLQLVAKPIDQSKPDVPVAETKPSAVTAPTAPFKPKPIPSPLTDAQLRDRREVLRQQAESLAARKRTVVTAGR